MKRFAVVLTVWAMGLASVAASGVCRHQVLVPWC